MIIDTKRNQHLIVFADVNRFNIDCNNEEMKGCRSAGPGAAGRERQRDELSLFKKICDGAGLVN